MPAIQRSWRIRPPWGRPARGIKLDPSVCRVGEPHFMRTLRRWVGRGSSKLVAYYVPATGSWCVGVWVNRLDGRVHEIVSFSRGRKPHRADIGFIRYWLSERRLRDNRALVGRVQSSRRSAYEHLHRSTERRRSLLGRRSRVMIVRP